MTIRKKLITSALILLLVAMAGAGTLAYFTAEDTATNVITSGNIDIELQETAELEDGSIVQFQESQERFGVMPGEAVSKIVKVVNTGDNEAYVRLHITKSINLAKGVEGDPDISLITMDFNSTNWTFNEADGFYYYNTALAPGAATEALFENVIFDPDMSNMYQGSEATIIVDAQATQVANNGASALEAGGWPNGEEL